ncbi:ABC transporter permease [Loigolactobacillus zhaoyuanensis]|uniref:ABC transporter permease n=1 Tax=Loigolactobacillus zhaoyuanensis TaxID=2486017 RepID=UPI000F73DEB8|nr:ABC transporter permease [Loigolactobacillus zhaoyuanensis]
MTKTWPLITTLFKQKSRSVHIVVGLQLLGAVLTGLSMLWQRQFSWPSIAVTTISYGVLAGMILFVLLAQRTEHIWTSNVFRLLPVSDLRLYLVNLGSTLLDLLYFLVIEIVITALCSLGGWTSFIQAGLSTQPWGFAAAGLVVMLALNLYGWTFISLVHLVGRTISSWLPEVRSRFVYFILYAVVGFILLKILAWGETLLQKMVAPLLMGQYDANIIPSIYSFSGILAVMIVLFSAINIYLLKYWAETKQTA